MTDQRASIVENAKYLRQVRPIDPDEIYEYVEGGPHPGVVRQVLREEAFDLGLVERDDGTFVPVDDQPVTRSELPDLPVTALPARYVERVEDLLVDEYGPEWYDGESGDRLREVIRRFKEDYYRQRGVEYDREVALGYAVYHLPAYYASIQYVLAELVERQLLGRHLRVLDVGAGVGGPALGLLDVLPDDALVEYHAVEPSAAGDVLAALLETVDRTADSTVHGSTNATVHGRINATVHRTTAEAFEPDREYDLVLCCNVLSELADPVVVVRDLLDALAPDGALVATAPADLNTSVELREVERAVEDVATVYSPTVRLWPNESPTDRCWSFDVQPDLDVPSFQRALDEAATDPDHAPGEFVNVDVQYSYSILRTDGHRRVELTPDPSRRAKLADADRAVTKRIDLVAIKLSHSLSESGNPLFLIGDGSQRVDHYAVLTDETSLNRALLEADYGDPLAFESALVLWNDDEEAYNLVVDEETIVDRIG